MGYLDLCRRHPQLHRGWHCRGCPQGGHLCAHLAAAPSCWDSVHSHRIWAPASFGWLHPWGMLSPGTPWVARWPDPRSCVQQRPCHEPRQCSAPARGWLARGRQQAGSRWSSAAGAVGAAGVGSRGQQEQPNQQPECRILQGGKWKRWGVTGTRPSESPGLGGCLAPSVQRGELTWLPIPPHPAIAPHSSVQ